ncbi:hypothetical protein BZL30_3003 [Mycobacterium kansasii]|uniref:Uncharacterized protein n=1 Tax=Mycobacterium kansasii TaxID=1768 RepID=A0A1V3XIU3_MYCKA|nr:hypothetical protein BZL30_3003 [Mycobacterium kansasii]
MTSRHKRAGPSRANARATALPTAPPALTLTGERICALTRFDNDVLPSFGLPRSLPG